MQKKNVSEQSHDSEPEKSLFRQAGEIIGSIGAHIIVGSDKMIGFVSEEVTTAKKAIKKKISGKKKVKKAAKKVSKKTVTAKKAATKLVKKAKKAVKKKTVKKPLR